MTLLIIVVALLVGHYMQWPQRLRDFGWYASHLDWLGGRLDLRGVWGLLLALALPVVTVLVVQSLLARGSGLVLGVAFAWLVLLYCLGPGHLLDAVNDYLEALDAEDAERTDGLRAALEREAGADQDPVAAGIVTRAHDEYFAVLFWFALLGPVGAVLYRFAERITRQESHAGLHPAADYLVGVLGWPSTRLVAFGLALMGHFDRALTKLTAGLAWQPDMNAGNRSLLAEVICAAVDYQPQADSATTVARRVKALVLRTLTLWLLVLAVLTLVW